MDVTVGLQRRLSAEELMLLNCGVGEDSWESLGLQGDPTSQSQRKSVLNIQLEGLMPKLKLQYFGHLMRRTGSMEKTLMLGKIEDRRRRGWQRMRWMDGITDSMDMSLSKLRGVLYSPWGWKELDTTERLNWTELMIRLSSIIFNCIKLFFIWNKEKHLITYLV